MDPIAGSDDVGRPGYIATMSDARSSVIVSPDVASGAGRFLFARKPSKAAPIFLNHRNSQLPICMQNENALDDNANCGDGRARFRLGNCI